MNICGGLSFGFKVLDFLRVGIQGHGLLLLVKFWPVNLLVRSVWTQEVLSIVHVSSGAGSVILHGTAWGEEAVQHVSGERNREESAHNDSGLGRGVHSDFESAVGLAKRNKT